MLPRVIQITDQASVAPDELYQRLARGGSGWAVQLRDPELGTRALIELGRALRRRTREVGAMLLVNDRLDVARVIEADGVHLGRRSVTVVVARAFLGETLVTCSAHSVDEAVALAEQGVDAVLLSPIFPSPRKGVALGVEALSAARARMPQRCGLFALGGLDRDSAGKCLVAGADGVAAVRADLSW